MLYYITLYFKKTPKEYYTFENHKKLFKKIKYITKCIKGD